MKNNNLDIIERGISFKHIQENCKTIGDIKKLQESLKKELHSPKGLDAFNYNKLLGNRR